MLNQTKISSQPQNDDRLQIDKAKALLFLQYNATQNYAIILTKLLFIHFRRRFSST
jgi:hypothetical protein